MAAVEFQERRHRLRRAARGRAGAARRRAPRATRSWRRPGSVLGVADAIARPSSARRDLRADGPFRLRQVDAAARRQRPQHGRRAARCWSRTATGWSTSPRCDADTLRAAAARSSVAMVFQQFALLPWRTVRGECRPRARARAACRRPSASSVVDEQLELVDLTSGPRNMRTSFPAACSSASALPAPSPPSAESC